MPTIEVQLKHTSYPIIVEPAGLRTLGEIAREHTPNERCVLCVDQRVAQTHGERARLSLANESYDVVTIEMEADERKKSLETVHDAYEVLLEERIERGTPVFAIGGGIVGDIAGFIAATFLRGLPFVQVPTTLLAMVDASIGGKTGINIEVPSRVDQSKKTLGKNLIGAFWQPRFVLSDPDVLATLDDRDYRCGLAECIKHGMITAPEHLTFMASHFDEIMERDPGVVTKLIAQSAQIKVNIVQEDERETGSRELLNLGHTFAHAMESVHELGLRHGEAVAIGLCAATFVAEETGRIDAEQGDSLRDLVGLFDLPMKLPENAMIDELTDAMRLDKKVRSRRIRLIVPCGIGSSEVVDDVEPGVIRRAWEQVAAL